MNVEKNTIDEVTASIKITIEKADYEPKVEENVREYRKKMQVKGFRPGQVPISLAKKLLGKAVIAETIEKMVTENLNQYIEQQNLEILGQPIPSEAQQSVDFDADKLEFVFDIGLRPAINTDFSQLEVPFYTIEINDELVEKEMNYIRRRYSERTNPETVEHLDEVLYMSLHQLDADGNELPDGAKIERTVLGLQNVQESERKHFAGAKVGDVIVFSPSKAISNETDLAALLDVKKDNSAAMEANYKATVSEIIRFAPSELTQEFFDKVYGEGNVKSEAEMREKVREEISTTFNANSDDRFTNDVRKAIIDNAQLSLPSEFLKRFLLLTNDNKNLTKEQIELSYPETEKAITWQIISSKLLTDNNLKVEYDEMLQAARDYTAAQFQQYGIPIASLPADMLDKQAATYLEDKNMRNTILSVAADVKIAKHLKNVVKLNTQQISVEEFNKLNEK